MFKRTKSWLSRITWKKLWRLIAPAILAILNDQKKELEEVVKKDADDAVKEIKEMVDAKLKK